MNALGSSFSLCRLQSATVVIGKSGGGGILVCVEVVFFTAGDIKCAVYCSAVLKTVSLALHIEERRRNDRCVPCVHSFVRNT